MKFQKQHSIFQRTVSFLASNYFVIVSYMFVQNDLIISSDRYREADVYSANEHALYVVCIHVHARLTHIVKEHVNTIGAGLLDGCVQRRDCLVIVGSIESNALEILHFLVTAHKPLYKVGGIMN